MWVFIVRSREGEGWYLACEHVRTHVRKVYVDGEEPEAAIVLVDAAKVFLNPPDEARVFTLHHQQAPREPGAGR